MKIEITDVDLGYFKAEMKFTDGSEIHLFEFVTIENNKPIVEKYRYHYQSYHGKLVSKEMG